MKKREFFAVGAASLALVASPFVGMNAFAGITDYENMSYNTTVVNSYDSTSESVLNLDLTTPGQVDYPLLPSELAEWAGEVTKDEDDVCGDFSDSVWAPFSESHPEPSDGTECFCVYAKEGKYYFYSDLNDDGVSKLEHVKLATIPNSNKTSSQTVFTGVTIPNQGFIVVGDLDNLELDNPSAAIFEYEQRDHYPTGADYYLNIWYGNGYAVMEGDNQTHYLNSGKDLTVHYTGTLEFVRDVLVDGSPVEESNLELKEGSVIATLKSSYLDTLSLGSHTLTIVYDDGEIPNAGSWDGGEVSATFVVSENPETFDEGMPWTAFGILGFSLGMFAVLGIADRFEKRR